MPRSKRHVLLFIYIILLLAMSACAKTKEESPAATTAETAIPETAVLESTAQETAGSVTAAPETTVAETAVTESEETFENQVNAILSGMSLYDKICQLLIVSPEDLTEQYPVTGADEATRQALSDMPVGGILYNSPNFVSKEQTKEMLESVQSYSKIPLILTCDEEGGRVNRLMNTVGTTFIGPMLDYREQGTDTAYHNAYTIASDMVLLGLNFDMAPVADVWSNPENTVIGNRAYSDDFSEAVSLVASAVDGFHAGGVGTALKHFPGHGDTCADSHLGAVYVTKTLDELRENELLPFIAGINAGSDMVMIGHLIISDVDEQPAPFSYKIVTELLRGELGFDGVVITDGLRMKAITDSFDSGEIACKAVLAGVDMLLCPKVPKEAVAALQSAVEQGTISEQRINESVTRILTVKIQRGIIARQAN